MKKILIKFSVLCILTVIIGAVALLSEEKPNYDRGAELWAKTCARCHEQRSVQDYNAGDWFTVSMHMRTRAGLTGQDTRDIILFLQSK